jgi:bacterioferritin-associated ferredoxin
MIICSCNVLSDHTVRKALTIGAPPRTIGELFRYIGSEAQCGRCAQSIKQIMEERPPNVGLLPPDHTKATYKLAP